MLLRKETYFKILLIFLPFLILAGAEIAFQWLNLFPREPLFIEKIGQGQSVYQVNPYVARRYFPPDSPVLPTLYPETFAKNKSPETLRIFCLGGSSTAGFPFDAQVPFPQQLRLMLIDAFRRDDFEVINLGLSAINSYSVLDLLPEVLEKSPDLILIYMGHNEFYGVYGSASSYSIGQNGEWIRFYLKLQKLRIVQALKTAIDKLTPAGADKRSSNESLMRSVIGKREIRYRSAEYTETLENFRVNLQQILQKCGDRKVPVILSNLVSNVKDLAPFGSVENKKLSKTDRIKLEKYRSDGKKFLEKKAYAEALKSWQAAISIDSLAANNWFFAGLANLGLGDTMAAADHFNRAKDRDVVRFRASEETNVIINNLAAQFHLPCVDMVKTFRSQSPQGVVGNSLICDHLHPNPDGYFLMAKAFFEKIRHQKLSINVPPNYIPPTHPYFVTDLDWDIGLLKIYRMTHRWPFPEKDVDFQDYTARNEPQSAKIAYDYIFKHQNWMKAHYEMAAFYTQGQKYKNARDEYKAVSAYFPKIVDPIKRIAQTFRSEKNWAAAEHFYHVATQFSPNDGMAFYQLALMQRHLLKIDEAIQNMETAVASSSLTPEQHLNAQYNLAGLFFEKKQTKSAIKILEKLIQLHPEFEPAQKFLQQLTSSK